MGTTSEARTDAQHIEASFADPDAFAVLFTRHAVPLQRYVVSRVGRIDAEDLVGETFATAFRARRSYDLASIHRATPGETAGCQFELAVSTMEPVS
jgi:RNA polymerase sigma-70 factor (ECF subfamily)